MSKRDKVLSVLKGKKMTMFEVATYCQDNGIVSFQNAKDAMNSMAYSKVVIKVGEKPNPNLKNGGHPMVTVFAINEDKPREKVGGYRPPKEPKIKGYPHRGLARSNISPYFRRKMMVKNTPLVLLYAKELKLTKEML